MAGLKFSRDLTRELEDIIDGASRAVTDSAKSAVRTAMKRSPWYTGTLHNAWRLSLTESGYVPKRFKQTSANSVPRFRFSLRRNDVFYIYNNMPYAEYVEEGINPKAGDQPPAKMLEGAINTFETELSRRFQRLRSR